MSSRFRFVAVQLLVVGVGNGLEPRLVLGHQHGLGIATEVGSRHRHDVGLVACHELADVHAELVVRIGGDVVELVHRDEPFVEGLHPEPVHGEAEGGVRADECPVVATQKRFQGVDLAALGPGRAAEVPLRPDGPVRPEAKAAERHVREARADRLLGNDDDCLAETLVLELVKRDEHERPALPRSRRRLDQEILLSSLLPGTLLHRAHPELVGPGSASGPSVADGYGGNALGGGHSNSSAWVLARTKLIEPPGRGESST